MGGYWGGHFGYSWGYMNTHGHDGWRCKKPKNIEWWKHLEKDNGFDGMTLSNVTERDRRFWVHKEYKHVADVYCDEWETPYWYTQQQEAKKRFEAELAKKAANATASANGTAAANATAGAASRSVPPELAMSAEKKAGGD